MLLGASTGTVHEMKNRNVLILATFYRLALGVNYDLQKGLLHHRTSTS